MKSNIFVPKKINVGFQNRSDTYTKKLAYIIYFDEKNKLRKEVSWNSWRDKNIDNIIFDNEPTEGFVLNKHVGGYCSGWEHRNSYIRIYDPRGFEFEISVENLLYILENCTSTKGKGLESSFIYGWDGKDLILIPTSSPDYIEISKYNEIVHKNTHIKAKDLILGATYQTKQNEEWIYMGKFDYYKNEYEQIPDTSSYRGYKSVRKNVNKGKYHYFVRESKSWNDELYLQTLILKTLGDKFISIISTDCVGNYANLFDKLECTTDYSPLDESKNEYIQYTFEEFCNKFNERRWFYCYSNIFGGYSEIEVTKKDEDTLLFEKRNDYSYQERITGTFEEIYNKIKPKYKNEYLKNGKLYREGK